jgi:hypothetical protein
MDGRQLNQAKNIFTKLEKTDVRTWAFELWGASNKGYMLVCMKCGAHLRCQKWLGSGPLPQEVLDEWDEMYADFFLLPQIAKGGEKWDDPTSWQVTTQPAPTPVPCPMPQTAATTQYAEWAQAQVQRWQPREGWATTTHT